MTTREPQAPKAEADVARAPAIQFDRVTKTYRLFGSFREQAEEVLGLRLPFRRRRPSREFKALDGINLKIARGEQVGLIGRNAAGKTTLLKLLTGNFSATSGTVIVNGTVQALMQTGLGFYPEFTGYENLQSALQYNGLTGKEFADALASAIAFVELGEYLHQPFKTYSLGMRSRLQFAAATAIHPDILIIDEVLGAGDAYFSGKSATRVKQLTSSGCTLLLVSHSMQQVLQFCTRVIWLESGKIAMEGDGLPVVRAYEEFTRHLEDESEVALANGNGSVLDDEDLRGRLLDAVRTRTSSGDGDAPELDAANVARWPSSAEGLRASRIRLLNSDGKATRLLRAGTRAAFELDVKVSQDRKFRARVALVIHRQDGLVATRLISDYLDFDGTAGGQATVRVDLPEVQMGEGRYVVSVSIHKELDLDNSASAVNFDLLARCFEFRVAPQNLGDPSLFYQSQSWHIDARR